MNRHVASGILSLVALFVGLASMRNKKQKVDSKSKAV